MRVLAIRSRMLLLALLPVTLVAVLLSAVFLLGRVEDIGQAHAQRVRTLARQVAIASEYGLFAGNASNLKTIAQGALRERDVRSVSLLNAQHDTVAEAGNKNYRRVLALDAKESFWHDAQAQIDVLVQPVLASQVALDEVFEGAASNNSNLPPVLGHVVIEVSRESVISRERTTLLVGMAVLLGGLLFGGLLALRLGRGIVRPMLRVTDLIERIGKGELTARGPLHDDDPLRTVQVSLNKMAQRLERVHEELEQQVAQATVELRQKKEEAESATQAKGRFLASASHDMRQPMHALGMFVARLAQLPHSAETKTLIKHLEVSVQAMQDQLDALLDISRLEAQAVKVNVQPFMLAEVLDQLQSSLMPMALAQGLKLRMRPSPVWLMSDPALLHSILLNLISNSLRYTSKGGVLVAARLSRGGRFARVEVWDTGVGIAPEHQQDIFKEFFQVSNSERDHNKGMGLGLNIVERTAKLLGHALALTSKPGQGTRFSIEVPLVPSPMMSLTPAPDAEPPVTEDFTGYCVLLIEDNALVAQAMTSLLQSWGCEVKSIEGAALALPLIAQGWIPDLIISDYRLREGENGIESVHRLRAAAGRYLPACLMSGDTHTELMHEARRAGLTLLHKPVRPAKLRSLIRRLRQPPDSDVVSLQPTPLERV